MNKQLIKTTYNLRNQNPVYWHKFTHTRNFTPGLVALGVLTQNIYDTTQRSTWEKSHFTYIIGLEDKIRAGTDLREINDHETTQRK